MSPVWLVACVHRIKLVLEHSGRTSIERFFADTPYSQLIERAQAMAAAAGLASAAGAPRLHFTDEEGDEISMTTEEGRMQAVAFFRPAAGEPKTSRYLKVAVVIASPIADGDE